MSIKKIIVLITSFVLFIPFCNALETKMEINPEWLKYIKLSDEEKEKYEAIPEKYIYIYVENSTNSLKKYKSNSKTLKSALPSYYNLTKLENKNYINSSSKNQSSLGLCWAFGAVGSAESNSLLNGVKGMDEMINKCDETDPNSIYCQYKKDKEINDKYRDGLLKDNATYSERLIDYILAKPYDTGAYNRSGLYQAVMEKYNPYNTNRRFGEGGAFSTAASLFAYGLSPFRTLNEWEKYNTNLTTMSLYQIYDSVPNMYQVTDYYDYPSAPSDSIKKEEWMRTLKENIIKYGSVYVSTVAPQQSSARACYYYDTKYNIDGKKQYIKLINYDGKCGSGSLGWHAMQIIGWDDNYTFGYCKVGNNAKDYTKEYCLNNGNTWTEGKGAWILKNSWGSISTYPYLSYDSKSLSISGVREVSVTDFDNIYNKINNNGKYESSVINADGVRLYQIIYKFNKTDGIEYLTKFNYRFYSYNRPYKVYVSNDNKEYKLIDEGIVDYGGLKTFYVDNFKLDNKEFFIKIITPDSTDLNAFTKNECSVLDNCDTNMELESTTDLETYKDSNKSFKIYTKTRNIPSGSKINYKIYNANDVDVTNLFNDIPNTYVIRNRDYLTLTAKDKLESGWYRLVSSYKDIKYEYSFGVGAPKVSLKLKDVGKIFTDDNNYQLDYTLSTPIRIINKTWSTSDESIATIDNDGLLNIKSNGKVKVKLTLETIQGEVSDEIEVVIYKKINTVDEFISIYGTDKAYYLNSDLDFKDNDLNKISDRSFKGILDGNCHILKNINISGEDGGIFSDLYNSDISNLKIIDSSFNGTISSGSLAGYAENSLIVGIYNSSRVVGTDVAGGIIGIGLRTNISESYNNGNILVSSEISNLYSGGIAGILSDGNIINSYNEGVIKAISTLENGNVNIYASGILAKTDNSHVSYSYNKGLIETESSVNETHIYKMGITNDYKLVSDSYYLKDTTYTVIDESFEKTIEDLKQKSTFYNWNFDTIWKIVDGKGTPMLQKFPISVTDVQFDLFSKTLNTNYEYDFTYEVYPLGSTDDIKIISEDESLFTIENNKIITKDKIGSSYLTFIVQGKKYTFPINVVNLFNIDYDKTLTGGFVDINMDYNYYLNKLDNQYIKLEYSINDINNSYSFEKNVISDKYSIRIDNMGILYLKLYVCDDSSCENIYENNFNIDNIDKVRPEIDIHSDNINKTLRINISDENGLSPYNKYLYGLSSSNKINPTKFNNYKLNEMFKDLSLSNENYYLWIKNVYDNPGNGLCDNNYCIYRLELEDNFYNLYYYDEDRVTLLKKERILENTKIVPSFNATKNNTQDFDYEFLYWEGYTSGMKLTKDTTLIAKFKGYFRGLSSNKYLVHDGMITNIKADKISSRVSVSEFKSNINVREEYNFYKGDLINPEFISTGMLYKSNYRTYRIVLMGDVTGDGVVKMNDVMKIASQLVNGNVLKDEYLIAGDVTGDNRVKMNDVMKIASGLVNGGSL